MIRFVVAPDRKLVPDLTATLPGRGIWLSAAGDVLETARAQGGDHGGLGRAFARAARGPVIVPPDLPAVLEAALVRRIGELVGLARRAGQAVAGFDKAREWLRTGRGRLILQASDGSAAERARFLSGGGGSVTVVDPLPAAALGRVFGRDHAVHVATAPGRLGERLADRGGAARGLRRRADWRQDRYSRDRYRYGRGQRVVDERNQRSGYRQGATFAAARGPTGARPDGRRRLRATELQSRPLQGGTGRGAQEARPGQRAWHPGRRRRHARNNARRRRARRRRALANGRRSPPPRVP